MVEDSADPSYSRQLSANRGASDDVATRGQTAFKPGHEDEFEGNAAATPMFGVNLMRMETLDVCNDPRIFLDNVISKRLAGFATVVVASILLATLAVSTLLAMEEKQESWIEFTGLALMNAVFVMNLFCVLVITVQYYQTFRLMTCGATGFEIAKSYYLNINIMTMRHLGISAFFYSIILFYLSIAAMLWHKLNNAVLATPIVGMTVIAAIVTYFAMQKHAAIFVEKYNQSKAHEKPLRRHQEHHNFGHNPQYASMV